MITIFSTCATPPNFRNANAVRSWQRLTTHVRVADDETSVERNEYGTPTVRGLIADTLRNFSGEVLCYVNADIILLEDLMEATSVISGKLESFLMVGRRWNWHRPAPVEMDGRWQDRLRSQALGDGELFNAASDYFCFTRDVFDPGRMPEFVVGHYWWDPWMMWSAMDRGIPVVDATESVLAIHQDHGIAHWSWDPQGARNRELAKEAEEAGIDLDDATWHLTEELELVKK
jgi:hypothetical protein